MRALAVDHPPTAARVELLNAMWRLSAHPHWLWGCVAGALALVALGCVLFPVSPVVAGQRSRACHVLLAALGSALAALGLAALYAVLTPPLFGPDEPYHLLGFAELVHDESLSEDTVAFMGQTHVLRIRYRPKERFRTVDLAAPFVGDDDQLKPTEVEMRSATLAAVWRAARPGAAGPRRAEDPARPAAGERPGVRAGRRRRRRPRGGCAGAARPQWLVFPFFFVPSLPFFAMHVSETAVLCSAYVLLATSLAVLFLDGPRAHWAGLPLGLSTALMLAGGRSPWPLAAVVGAALAARVLLGANGASPRRAAAVFWSGVALGLGVYWLVLNDGYLLMMSYWSRFVPRPAAPAVGLVRAARRSLVVVALAPAAVARDRVWRGRARALAARLAPRLRTRRGLVRNRALRLGDRSRSSARSSSSTRTCRSSRGTPWACGERVAAVLSTMATLFRLTDPNFLLATTFWVGFGWLDAIPGPVFQALLVAAHGRRTVGLLRALSRPPQLRRLSWLLGLAVGGVLSLVLYTVVTQDLPMALQGRYLIGWYLVFLTLAGCWLAGVASPRSADVPAAPSAPAAWIQPAVLLLVAGGIHVYCLTFILRRYF